MAHRQPKRRNRLAIVVVPVCGKPATITLPRIKLEAFVVIHGCMAALGSISGAAPGDR